MQRTWEQTLPDDSKRLGKEESKKYKGLDAPSSDYSPFLHLHFLFLRNQMASKERHIGEFLSFAIACSSLVETT
jgi:hypothetical protein